MALRHAQHKLSRTGGMRGILAHDQHAVEGSREEREVMEVEEHIEQLFWLKR